MSRRPSKGQKTLQSSTPSTTFSLSLEFAVSLVIALVLFFLDKGGKTGPSVFGLLLISMALVLCYAIYKTPLWSEKGRKSRIIVIFILVTAVTVPFGLYVWPSPTRPAVENDGFVQFEDHREIVTPLAVGERVRMNFYFSNRGEHLLKDVQSWGSVLIVDPKTNPPKTMKRLLDGAVQDGYIKFKGEGSDLGVDQTAWNTAVSNDLLSEEMVKKLRAGESRMFFNEVVAWTDERNRMQFSTHCEWVDWTTFPDPNGTVWHFC